MSDPVFQVGRGFAPEQVNRQRELSIPGPIFWHMVKNPLNHQVYKKMIQTCKYPFSKNKVIPVGYMRFYSKQCTMATSCEEENTKSIDVNLAEGTCKFWLTDVVHFHCADIDYDLFLPRLYRCDAKEFYLKGPIPFSVYQKMFDVGTLTALQMCGDVKHSDDSLATVEQLLGHLPNLEKIRWQSRHYWPSLVNNSVKTLEDAQGFFERLSSLKKLHLLDLIYLPLQCFPAFDDFVKENQTVDVQLRMTAVISAAYKGSIKAFMEETLENRLVKVPIIGVEYPNNFDQVLSKRYNELANSTTDGKKIDRFFLRIAPRIYKLY